MIHLTPRQREVLEFVRGFAEERGAAPTVREVARRFGFSSPATAQEHLAALRRKGRLEAGPSLHRGLSLKARRPYALVPILGRVAAGPLLLAEEHVEGYLAVDRDLAKGGRTFALRVKGDSMKNAGILDGDTVIVRAQSAAEPGDVVVALKEDEATVKYFRRTGGRAMLVPANPAYEPMELSGFEIIGKVVTLIRRY